MKNLYLFNVCRAGIVFAAMVALSPCAFADADGISIEKYPDADVVLVDGLDYTEYFPDGTYVNTDETVSIILTEKGRREESEIVVRYNARYGTSEIVSVSIIEPDGTERPIDVSSTTKESTDNSSASENIYDPMQRKIVCTVPGLKVGDRIKYKTRREMKKPRVENLFADMSILEWICPVVKNEIRILAPAERPIKTMAIRHPIGNVTYSATTNANGSILHSWVVRDSPQAFPEPDMPPIYTLLQNVRVSTASNWNEISAWYWNLCLPHLAKTNESITNKVGEIAASVPGDGEEARLDKIKAIYKWVAQEVRYMGLTMEDTSPGYAPHDVDITFENRYGVCRDKAALLAAMLRVAGFDAFPVLIHGGVKMDVEVPSPFFNHAIVAVRAPGSSAANADGFILMDPTDESSRDLLPSYLSDKSYLVATPEGEPLHTSQVPSADENAVKIVTDGSLEKDGSMLLSTTIDILGVNDNIYRGSFLRQKPEDRRKLMERVVRKASASAELLSFDLQPVDLQNTAEPLSIKILTRIPETVLKGGTRDELTVPFFSKALGLANWLLQGNTSLVKRRFPLDINSTACTDEKITIKLEGNVGTAMSLPEDVIIEGPYEFRRNMSVSNGILSASRRLAINAVEFNPDEYSKLREDIQRVESAERERAVFGKDFDGGANIRHILSRRDYVFENDRTWTVTNTVVKKVLTYKGKKSAAELTLGWNPVWQNVELLSATVTNPDGKTVSVSEKEKNEFDCAWAAAAPRYLASKQLVVNLPSVEVGSIISYVTVTTVSNSPTAYYGTFYKDVFEPTDRLIVTLRCPHAEKPQIIVDETNPKLLKSEPSQPDGRLWRKYKTISYGDFGQMAKRLFKAADVKPCDWRLALGADVAEPHGLDGVKAIRDWMAKNVRIAGPDIFELPIDAQLTWPETVLKERYATRLDYIRTMVTLLRGAGYDADIVFSSSDANEIKRLKDEDESKVYCRDGKFRFALCRVTMKSGGFLGLGAKKTVYFLGTENEYTPLGATAFVDSSCLDPATAEISKVTVPDESLRERAERKYNILVRENGAVDIDFEEKMWGPGVGSFRKGYAEMLPEDRSRHYQELLGAIAQAATATHDLVTDVESYPAVLKFSCYVPDFATVANDALTLTLPDLGAHIFPLAGTVRETPIAIDARSDARTVVAVSFPEGWSVCEHEPEPFLVEMPVTENSLYAYEIGVDEEGKSGYASRTTFKRGKSWLSPIWFEHLKALDKRVTSRDARTIIMRKAK